MPPCSFLNQNHSVGDIFARGFHVMDANLLVLGRAGGVERFSVSIDVDYALAELELSRDPGSLGARVSRIKIESGVYSLIVPVVSAPAFGSGLLFVGWA